MTQRKLPIPYVEFVVIAAMMFATIAFSIDSMLPAIPQIASELSPDAPNNAQLILSSFVLGMGLGTLFTGPLADAFGRKPVIMTGAVIYIGGALIAYLTQDLGVLLAARFVQGLGVSAPRVALGAIVRDMFAGREMARLMSFVMMVFSLVPAIAPTLGMGIIALWGWRSIFLSFVVFIGIGITWLALRVPETLAEENRKPFNVTTLIASAKEVLANPVVRHSMYAQTLCFGMLMALISNVQPLYDITFGRAESFPFYFGAIAVISASAALLNARLVMRLGMAFLVRAALLSQVGIASIMLLLCVLTPPAPWFFAAFLFWQTSVFFQTGLTLGNLNAIAMEPMGHLAGTTASITSAVSTVLGGAMAVPVGLAFDGTPVPLAVMTLLASIGGVWVMGRMARIRPAA